MLLFEVFTWLAFALVIAFLTIRLRGGRLVAHAEQLRLLALAVAGGLVGGSLGGLMVGDKPGGYRLGALLLAGATAAVLLYTVGPDRRPRARSTG